VEVDEEANLSRTARKRAERTRLIARTAARLFADGGYDTTNFEDIAAVLDMRGPSLYHYFPSKEALFLACLHDASSVAFERLRTIARSAEPPRLILRALIREQVVIELRDFPEFVPLFFGNRVGVPAIRDEVLRLRREHAEVFESIAAEVRADEGLESEHVRVWLAITFGALAYLDSWFDPTGPLDVDALAHRMSGTLMSSL
jgi:AcrR family transcriptional regulator